MEQVFGTAPKPEKKHPHLFCSRSQTLLNQIELECGPMPNVMAALRNIGGSLCSTPQSLADAHYWSAVQQCCQDAAPVEISWGAPNYQTDLS